MGIRIIAEGVYDTAHAVYEAHEILKTKPDAVFFELPVTPFQDIFNGYGKGNFGVRALKKKLFSAMKKVERRVEEDLVSNFLNGKIEAEDLDFIGRGGREIHALQAAKKVKARIYAMDISMDELEKETLRQAKSEHLHGVKKIHTTRKLPPLVWKLNEIVHFPYYFLERLMRHSGILTTNPYKHNVNECGVCKLGAHYDRVVTHILFGFLSYLPFSEKTKKDIRIAYLFRYLDFIRERYMASVVLEKCRELKKELKREPKIIVIVHLWNAGELLKHVKDA